MQNYSELTTGVLALQGDFERHEHHLKLLGANFVEVRTVGDLKGIDGLIIPGGESTTMSRLLDRFVMRDAVTEFCRSKPVWGTCAGMIMLASEVINDNRVIPLKTLDISVLRNGYGRQVFSFFTEIQAALNGTSALLKASFIRAPKVTRVGEGIKILAEYAGEPVLLMKDNCLASSFHTELEEDYSLTKYFIDHFILKNRN